MGQCVAGPLSAGHLKEVVALGEEELARRIPEETDVAGEHVQRPVGRGADPVYTAEAIDNVKKGGT